MHFRFNGVSERDMDLFFLEEFAVNQDFLKLFLRKIEDVDFSGYEVVSEEVSFADPDLGESDLTIDLEKEGHRVSLLIEDKINAIAQPRQYERYVERGEKSVREDRCDVFYVFLIAPAEYIKGNESAEKYSLRVTYVEDQIAKNRIDIVLSHTCPYKYEPRDAFLPMIDQSTVDDSTERWLDGIEEKADYKAWLCGHWHIEKQIDKLRFLFHDVVSLEMIKRGFK